MQSTHNQEKRYTQQHNTIKESNKRVRKEQNTCPLQRKDKKEGTVPWVCSASPQRCPWCGSGRLVVAVFVLLVVAEQLAGLRVLHLAVEEVLQAEHQAFKRRPLNGLLLPAVHHNLV